MDRTDTLELAVEKPIVGEKIRNTTVSVLDCPSTRLCASVEVKRIRSKPVMRDDDALRFGFDSATGAPCRISDLRMPLVKVSIK